MLQEQWFVGNILTDGSFHPGASGYLGGRICHAVAKEGYIVRALARRSSVLDNLHQGEVEIVYGDVTDLPSLLEACSGCDILIHVAALAYPWLPDR